MRLPSALPALAGGWLKTFRIVWLALFAVAVVGGTAGTWRMVESNWERNLAIYGAGIRTVFEGSRITISPLAPETVALGIVPGSTLVAIDGQNVSDLSSDSNVQALADALDGPDAAVKRLTLRSPEGRLETFAVARGPQYLAAADRVAPLSYAGRYWLALTSYFAQNFIFLAGAALLFRRRAGDSVVALLATGFVLGAGLDLVNLVTLSELGEKLISLIDGLAFTFVLVGITVFPSGRFDPKWSLLILLAPVVAVAPFLPEAWSSLILRQETLSVFVAISIAAVVRRFFLLPAGPQRQQIKWAVLGFAIFAVLFVFRAALAYVDTLISDNTAHFALLVLAQVSGTGAYLALVGGLLVSLLRYRLYDADAAISRSAVYGALTLGLVAIFSGSEKLVELLGEEFFGEQVGPAAGAIAAGLAALFLVPMHHRLTAWAERRFQRDLLRLRTRLPERLRDLQLTSTPEALADVALAAVCAGVRATRAAILLPEVDGWRLAALRGVSDEDAAVWLAETAAPESPARDSLFPAAWRLADADEPPSGVLVLGPRPDGSLCGKDERETLEGIAEPLGRALAVALARSTQEAMREADRQSLHERMAGLEADLAGVLARLANSPRRRIARA